MPEFKEHVPGTFCYCELAAADSGAGRSGHPTALDKLHLAAGLRFHHGRFAVIQDPQGVAFGLHEARDC